MALSCGIVGLPNVGKSTIFNALTRSAAALAANYPFATIEPNIGEVPVPDERLKVLAQLVNSNRIVHATMRFVDIAGLVRGASSGAGLGNAFLSHIRETDAIAMVVRCFDDPDVTHVEGSSDPRRDVEIVGIEMALADLASLAKRMDKLEREARVNPKVAPLLTAGRRLHAALEAGTRNPGPKLRQSLMQLFGCDFEDLFQVVMVNPVDHREQVLRPEGGVRGVEAVGPVDDEAYSTIESFVLGVVDLEADSGEDPLLALREGPVHGGPGQAGGPGDVVHRGLGDPLAGQAAQRRIDHAHPGRGAIVAAHVVHDLGPR